VYGKVRTVPLENVPTGLVRLAERCAHLVVNGLYGLHIQEAGGRFLVMEINDNPNIDRGFEDKVLGEELYRILMRTFRDRLENRGLGGGGA